MFRENMNSAPAEIPETAPGNGLIRIIRQEARPVYEHFALPFGELVSYTSMAPNKEDDGGRNEDALAIVQMSESRAAFIVADGMGGYAHGAEAAMLTVSELSRTLLDCEPGLANPGSVRDAVAESLHQSSRRIQERYSQAGATVSLALFDDRTITLCHAGDSECLIANRKGAVKMHTVPHSPVGQACALGLLSEQHAMFHELRHVVDNAVGLPSLALEFSESLRMEEQDTLLAASDGLYDNLFKSEILHILANDSLLEAARQLVTECQHRMSCPLPGTPSKPDDLSILLFRSKNPEAD